MPRKEYVLSGYRGMWLFAMFDLPVKTKEARQRYAKFRKCLLEEGFSMLQFSVYARYCGSEQSAVAFRNRLRVVIPPMGHVRFLAVTDHQFGKMENYVGIRRKPVEEPPPQLMLF